MMYFFNISTLLPYFRIALSWKSSLQKYPTSPTTHPDKILPSQHSHWISLLFLFLSAASSIFLFSLSRNPNVSFLCSQFVHFPSLRHSQSLFHSMYFAFLFSCVSDTLLSLLSTMSSAPTLLPLTSAFTTQKFSLLTAFFFSLQALPLSSIYHMETPSLPLSCFIQRIFL